MGKESINAMDLADILQLEGIVIRKIPLSKTSYWCSSDKAIERHKIDGGKTVFNDKGRELAVEHKELSMGGKYLITFAMSQDATVIFSKKRDGIGATIEDAYRNYLGK